MAKFSLSPAVVIQENDYSQYVGQLPSAKTGFIVRADTGYCNKIMPFKNELDLIALVGKPTSENYIDWFDAWNFTNYASSGYLVRPMNKSVKNAAVEFITSGTPTGTKLNLGNFYNTDVAELTLQGMSSLDYGPLVFINRYVTSKQDLMVMVCASDTTWDKYLKKTTNSSTDGIIAYNSSITIETGHNVKFSKLVDYKPIWADGEFLTVILKKNTSGNYEIVDKKVASTKATARDHQNTNMYANEVFFYGCKYVYCYADDGSTATTVDGCYAEITGDQTTSSTAYDRDIIYTISEITKADIVEAANLFADAEGFDINILVRHELDYNGMNAIASDRKDCVAIVTPGSDFITKLVGKSATEASQALIDAFGTQTANPSIITDFNTYFGIWGNLKYQYDKFNDVNRWVSLAGDKAGLMAQTDSTDDPWWASEGLTRGKIKNCIKLAFNPSKGNRDDLYVNSINPVIPISGEGRAISFGNKTATKKASAVDRMNVRRLLIYIEKAVATAVKYGLFEFNDSFTRGKMIDLIEPFLRSVKGRRGIVLYDIKCDEDNNTPEVIEQNGLVIDISILPNKTAEFINLNINIYGNSVTFTESVGKTSV